MKCALELNVLKAMAEQRYQEEQERAREQARLYFEEVTKRTINYAENVIGVALENKANHRELLWFEFKGWESTDLLGNVLVAPLISQGKLYANGDESFTWKNEDSISLDVLKQYLDEHCISMSYSDSSFMSYGSGCRKCLRIEIKVSAI